MDPTFREMFEGLKQTADGLILANYQERNIRNFHQHLDRYLADS